MTATDTLFGHNAGFSNV